MQKVALIKMDAVEEYVKITADCGNNSFEKNDVRANIYDDFDYKSKCKYEDSSQQSHSVVKKIVSGKAFVNQSFIRYVFGKLVSTLIILLSLMRCTFANSDHEISRNDTMMTVNR